MVNNGYYLTVAYQKSRFGFRSLMSKAGATVLRITLVNSPKSEGEGNPSLNKGD